tara:strand:- start:832 stop:1584 length:753 start_codon:yes stop_codon:yes gene_type:complete
MGADHENRDMTNTPWFPFWCDDFLASPKVRMMKPEEVGVYILLLCEQHQNGRVKWPCERKASALQTHDDCIEYVLAQCFKKDRHGFYSPRLRQIHAEQDAKSQQGKRAAEARWGKGSHADASGEHMPAGMLTPMQTDSNQNQNQKNKQNHIKETPPTSPRATGANTVKRTPTRAVQLPQKWTPTNAHRERASAAGTDIEREAERFRLHAETNERTAKNWNAAFTTWLMRSEDFSQSHRGKGTNDDYSHLG